MVWIIWILMSGLCALLAKDKNRSVGLAILCGLLFGVFAVIYYIAVGKKECDED